MAGDIVEGLSDILAVVGIWSSKRRLWKGWKDKMAVVKVFLFTAMPFVIAEIATGVVSFLTGELRVPPAIGVGTAVDVAVLLAGLAVAFLRVTRTEPKKALVGEQSESG